MQRFKMVYSNSPLHTDEYLSDQGFIQTSNNENLFDKDMKFFKNKPAVKRNFFIFVFEYINTYRHNHHRLL